MKSKLFKAVFGISLFALALNVNANTINSVTDGSNTTDATVTVGEVAAPVYGADIIWNNLTFNWVYDNAAETFRWKPADACSDAEVYTSDEFNEYSGQLYEDSSCTTEATEYTERDETVCDEDGNCVDAFNPYYHLEEREEVFIIVRDESENGSIIPSIRWNASSKYEDVSGKFQYRAKTCVKIETEEMFEAAASAWDKNNTDVLFTDSTCDSSSGLWGGDESITFEKDKYYTLVYPYVELTTEERPNDAYGFHWDDSTFDEYNIAQQYPFEGFTLKFNLEGGSTTPTAGDEIGTITISIRAK